MSYTNHVFVREGKNDLHYLFVCERERVKEETELGQFRTLPVFL